MTIRKASLVSYAQAVPDPTSGCPALTELAGAEVVIQSGNITALNLRAAVRQPALAGCGAAVHGKLAGFDKITVCGPPSGSYNSCRKVLISP